MAINAYTGLMGSGKSYEVVSSVIVPAVIAGRRVVTNIDGIQPDLVREYCINVRKVDEGALGEIVPVTNDDVTREGFFPDETKPDAPSIVKPGDLVAIDEAWNFWSTSGKLSPEHMRFFRMHRHYVHPDTGIACDVALMIQSIGDLHRQLRAVVEITFVTKKLKELGFNTRYRVEMYEGGKVTKLNRLDTFNKTYSKAVFPLYQSYSGGNGKENAIDRRQNLLSNKRLWGLAIAVVACWSIGGTVVWRYFHPDLGNAAKPATTPVHGSGEVMPDPANYTNAPSPAQNPFSAGWRVAGHYTVGDGRYIVVADGTGRLRVESPSLFQNSGIAIVGTIDGEKVTFWTGVAPTGRGGVQ